MSTNEQEVAYMTTYELADRMGVSSETIRKWRNADKIRPSFVTPGGRPRWQWPPLGLTIALTKEQAEAMGFAYKRRPRKP